VRNGFSHIPTPVGHFSAIPPLQKRNKGGNSRFCVYAVSMLLVVLELTIFTWNLFSYFDACKEVSRIEEDQKKLEKQVATLELETEKKARFLKLMKDMDYFLDLLRETEGFALPDEKILPIMPPPRVR
jgi:cell division protein FtsB